MTTGGADEWLAPDKFQHIVFCFSLTLLFSFLASRTRYQFLRRRSFLIGASISLLAGAAKEVADQLGFFRSAGASVKDGVADVVGVVIGCVVLWGFGSVWRRRRRKAEEGGDPLVEVSTV
ncbi:hypothetical protein Droror1_Dr00010055 [Drosera rotundifolia]